MDRKDERIMAFRSIVPFAFVLLLILGWVPKAQAAPSSVLLLGEVERITLDNSADHFSGGTIVVGGQIVILPRNLLLDLPANRLTLKQLFDQAPAACVANGETGLAKADACNTSGAGGFATLSANRSDAGNVIAGDVLIEKGKEMVTGTVTFINYNDGYYRLSGQPNVDIAGVIVRLNDPTSRHTVQRGLGCLPGSANCSPDPRFTLDPDNYTNSFSNGFPYCLPSTVPRTFTNILGDNVTSSAAAGNGTGDYLCPETNRPAALNTPAADSRRLAPLKVGDSVTAEGNFEIINGVTFLSAHTSSIGVALSSAVTAGQPDYFTLAEVFMDAPAFFNRRYRTLIIGYTTLANPATDVLFWTIHRDKVNNAIHELPWTSVLGCDAADGAGTCSAQGLAGAGGNIFRIRHDIDFLLAAGTGARFGGAAKPGLSLCAMLRGETRFGNTAQFCPSADTNPAADGTGSLADEFAIFSPIPHEIIGRTGRKVADVGGTIRSIDVSGNEATWGTYLFPFGINLGGISLQEMNEIDLNLISTPNLFEGIPWNLDRRLSPGGCNGLCEPDVPGNPYAYALSPFPYSGLHPKTALANLVGAGAGGLPTGPYTEPNFTASTLTDVQNRMFSFVGSAPGAIFNGNNTLIANTSFAPLIPSAFPIVETPALPAPPPVAANAVTLTSSPVGSALPGATVVFTGLASGGSGTYEYEYRGRPIGVLPYAVARSYNPLTTWNWTASPGNWEIQVNARSIGSTAQLEATNSIFFTVANPAADNVTLTPLPAGPQAPGTSVTFTAVASGGSGSYEYEFRGRPQGSTGPFALAQAYSPTASWPWTSAAGSWEIQVNARNAGSTSLAEATRTITYVVSAPAPLAAVAVDLTPSPLPPPNPVAPALVTFNAAVTDPPSGSFEYEFRGRPQGSTGPFAIAQSYSPTASWPWTSAAGSWEIQVNARSVGSAAAFEATQTIIITVD
jgi:hypothetical protein